MNQDRDIRKEISWEAKVLIQVLYDKGIINEATYQEIKKTYKI